MNGKRWRPKGKWLPMVDASRVSFGTVTYCSGPVYPITVSSLNSQSRVLSQRSVVYVDCTAEFMTRVDIVTSLIHVNRISVGEPW